MRHKNEKLHPSLSHELREGDVSHMHSHIMEGEEARKLRTYQEGVTKVRVDPHQSRFTRLCLRKPSCSG